MSLRNIATSAVIGAIQPALDDVPNIGRNRRRNNSGLVKDGQMRTQGSETTIAAFAGERDWRVSLSLPTGITEYQESPVLQPLRETGNKLIFPYTPTIVMSQFANYNSTSLTNTNYAYNNYINSTVTEILISCDFTVENEKEGQYWVAMLHYLRTVTKMFYGKSDSGNSGAPPPIIKLNGYGDFVFNNIPCVITNFTVDLQPGVDYIATSIGGNLADTTDENGRVINANPRLKSTAGDGIATTWVPTQSMLTVSVQPNYSRRRVEEFSLQNFADGKYISSGKGFI